MPSRLAEHLVARGLLRPEVVNEALRHQALAGGGLDTALLEQSALSEADLLAAVSEVSGVRSVNLTEFEPNHEVAPLIPPKIAERLCVVPLSLDGGTLHVACGYPVPKTELDEVGFLLGKQLVLWVSSEPRIRDWISIIYKTPLASRFGTLLAQLDPSRPLPASSAQAPRPAAAPAAAPVSPPPPAPAPAPAQAAAPAPVPAAGRPIPLVEERTLEESLSMEMIEQIAREVASEPIPLEVKKRDRPLPPEEHEVPAARPPPPAAPSRPPPPAAAPAQVPVGRRPTLDELPAVSPRTPTQPEHPAAPVPAPRPVTQPMVPVVTTPATRPITQPMGAAVTAPPSPPAPSAPPAKAPPPAAAAPRPATQPMIPAAPAPSRPAAPPPQAPSRPVEPERPPQVSGSESALAGSALVVDPLDATRGVVPDWTLAQARAALKQNSADREQLIDVALRFARRTFEYAAAFAVIRGSAVGWDVRGEGTDRAQLAQLSIPLDVGSVFRTVALTRGSYVGPLPPEALSRHYLEQMGRTPRTVFLYPVEVKARLVAILYGDSGVRPVSQLRLSELILFCQDLPAAFQELILHRKQKVPQVQVPLEFEVDVDLGPSAAPASSQMPARPPSSGMGWSPFAANELGGLGRAASVASFGIAEGERPPPDFGPVLRRLTGPDAAQRARAMAELSRSPEPSSRVLAEAFPGPTAWSRLPVQELPEADELGPIPGALSRLGRAGAQALAPLLDADDSDTRYLALLTAGNLPYPELVDGILRGLFDLEPDISSAARAAATAFRRVARFDASLKALRQELASRDAMRRSLAARALGVLHDLEAIDGLIMLTGSDDSLCAQAAAEALKEITRVNFGPQPRSWTMWWAENRGRKRVEWLVTALRSSDLEVRLSAFEELTRATSDSLGYDPDGEPAAREAAVRRWEEFVQQSRARFDVI